MEEKNIKPRAYSQIYEGNTIETSFAMEPGEQYEHELGDFYNIKAKGVGVYASSVREYFTLQSLDQLREFAAQLNAYIESEENRINPKNS